jgi:hypothetical protein
MSSFRKMLSGLLVCLLMLTPVAAREQGSFIPGLGRSSGVSEEGLYLGAGSTNVASLSLPFYQMATGADLLAKGVTYTSSGLATQYDSTGKLTWKPNNLLLQSNTFSNAAWVLSNATLTSGQADYLGGTSAWLLASAAAPASAPIVSQSSGVAVNGIAMNTVVVKAAGLNYVVLGFQGEVANAATWFNLSNGTVGTRQSNNATATITPLGNGWYRVAITAIASGITEIAIYGAAADNSVAATTPGLGIYINTATASVVTHETIPRPADQVITTSAAYYGPRFDFDPVTLAAKGLLIEESRTNLTNQSEDFDNASWTVSGTSFSVTANQAVAPNGLTTADKLNAATTGLGDHFIYQAITVASTSTNTFTVYVKAAEYNWATVAINETGDHGTWVDLSAGTLGTTFGTLVSKSITSVGSGWYRISITRTATATNATPYVGFSNADKGAADGRGSFAGTVGSGIYAWGAQLELGSYATSYLPTGASSVTRASEVESFVIPAGVTNIRTTYDDNTTANTAVTPGATYTIPTGQKAIKSIVSF